MRFRQIAHFACTIALFIPSTLNSTPVGTNSTNQTSSAIAPKFEFVLLCDDIRSEVGDKSTIVGVYDYHIVVPTDVKTLPKICFYARFSNMTGDYTFETVIVSPSGKRKTAVKRSPIRVEPPSREATFRVIEPTFDVTEAGIYSTIFTLTKNGQRFE